MTVSADSAHFNPGIYMLTLMASRALTLAIYIPVCHGYEVLVGVITAHTSLEAVFHISTLSL